MSEFDHVRVLSAYLSRLRLVDFERLHKASIETTHQQLHGNNRSQLDAQEAKFDVIRDAVKGMIDHDKEICARIVRESVIKIIDHKNDCPAIDGFGCRCSDA